MEKDKEQEKDREKDKQHGERKDKARLDENGAGGKETCKKLIFSSLLPVGYLY